MFRSVTNFTELMIIRPLECSIHAMKYAGCEESFYYWML